MLPSLNTDCRLIPVTLQGRLSSSEASPILYALFAASSQSGATQASETTKITPGMSRLQCTCIDKCHVLAMLLDLEIV